MYREGFDVFDPFIVGEQIIAGETNKLDPLLGKLLPAQPHLPQLRRAHWSEIPPLHTHAQRENTKLLRHVGIYD